MGDARRLSLWFTRCTIAERPLIELYNSGGVLGRVARVFDAVARKRGAGNGRLEASSR